MNSIKTLNEEFNESKKTIQSLIETSGNIIGKETLSDTFKSKMGDNITINLFEKDAVFLESKKSKKLDSESDNYFNQKNLETLKTNKIAFGGDDEDDDDDNLSKYKDDDHSLQIDDDN